MMKTSAVIDSNVLVAFIDDRDKWHSLAYQMFSALKVNQIDVIYALVCRELNIRSLVSFDQDFDFINWLSRISQPVDISSSS